MSTSPPNTKSPFMSVRTLLILVTALLAGLVVAGLTFLQSHNISAAIIAGMAVFGVTTLGLNSVIDP